MKKEKDPRVIRLHGGKELMIVTNEPNYFLNVDKKFSQSPRVGDKKYKSFPHRVFTATKR
jgi:hypothetical protein